MSTFDRPRFARMYLRLSPQMDARGARDHRRRLLDGLRGRVLEIGAGNGLNFALYPKTVEEVVAVEPEIHLRRAAQDAAAAAPVPIRVVAEAAESLTAAEGEFDAVVLSLVLCSVSDQAAALGEASRVLREDGELRFYEHVIARDRGFALVQKVLDATIWPRIAGGCHAARDTETAIRQAGFSITQIERFAFRASVATAGATHSRRRTPPLDPAGLEKLAATNISAGTTDRGRAPGAYPVLS